MKKLDLTKEYKSYYTAKPTPEVIEVAEAPFLSIRGKGDPSDAGFAQKTRALYSVAYAIKFACKGQDKDFVVAKLEGLWWFDEQKFGIYSMDEAPQKVPRSEWEYQLLIRMPDFVLKEEVEEIARAVALKKDIPLVKEVVFYRMSGVKAVQMLHIGPFEKEPETLKQLLEFIKANNFKKGGKHHEIYLSDFNKTSPEKLRTILREPILPPGP